VACTANTDSISLAINAGVLTGDLLLAPAPNGLAITSTGVTCPTNVTCITQYTVANGQAVSFSSGDNKVIGPTMMCAEIDNPSADRPLNGLFIARATGEIISFDAGTTAVVSFQVSIDGGSTFSTQDQAFYDNTPSGNIGYGGHLCSGTLSIAAGGIQAANLIQLRMFIACSAGGGNILNSGDLDNRIMLVNS
jgi:hypothetical protein